MGKHSKFKKKVKMAERKILTKEESAEMQEVQSAEVQTEPLASPDDMSSAEHEDVSDGADVNPPSTVDDGRAVAQPVPVVPSVPPQTGTGQPTAEQKKAFDDLITEIKGLLDEIRGMIPSDENHIIDFSLEANRKAFAAAFSPTLIDLLHELFKERRKEIDDKLADQRIEVECEGKILVFENESAAYVAVLFEKLYRQHQVLKEGVNKREANIEAYNKLHHKDRVHMLSEFRNAAIVLKNLKIELKNYIKQSLDTAIENKKANLKPAPIKPDNNDFWAMLRYCLISVPSYKAYCFLTDRYTLGFFHTAILTVLVALLGLIGFMAHNEAKLEREAEKYAIVRMWSYIDDNTPYKNRVRILDGLFEDEKNNRQDINDLVLELRQKFERQQAEKAKSRRK